MTMPWDVQLDGDFEQEVEEWPEPVQDELFANAKVLKEFGPSLGRPKVDTLKGSRHANMKELRFNANGGVWRVAFAFDRDRRAILLVGGDKGGEDEKRFYKRLIDIADRRFDTYHGDSRR